MSICRIDGKDLTCWNSHRGFFCRMLRPLLVRRNYMLLEIHSVKMGHNVPDMPICIWLCPWQCSMKDTATFLIATIKKVRLLTDSREISISSNTVSHRYTFFLVFHELWTFLNELFELSNDNYLFTKLVRFINWPSFYEKFFHK